MLFSSATFICYFLPFLFACYFSVPQKYKNSVLLVFSILFYSWGNLDYTLIIFADIVNIYLGGLLISKLKSHTQKKFVLMLCVWFLLFVLLCYKYLNFFSLLMEKYFSIKLYAIDMLPIGISFYTFQAISYLADVYKTEVKAQKNIFSLALYISFFPQLVAGPIIKYKDISEQINHRHETAEKFCYGVKRFIVGLAKKVLIADVVGMIADRVFAQPITGIETPIAWLGAVSYALQIYYDFSGYSDMAIGLGAMFGFKIRENFNYPYISKSITEFWRRWHISLGSWFKEYLYIPLGGNRKGLLKTCLNLFFVFLVTGFWHGAAFNFIVWGIFYGFWIIFEKITQFHKLEGNIFLNVLQHIYALLIIIVGWVLFRADNLGYAADYIRNMFGLIHEHQIVFQRHYFINRFEMLIMGIAALGVMPVFSNMLNVRRKYWMCLNNIWLLLIFVLSVFSIIASTYHPFIYFRF